MNVIKADLAQPIMLGRQGEHGVTKVVFDLSGYIKKYGDGVASLIVKRPGDPLEYPVIPTRAEDTAVWEIGLEWTEFAGQGWCQLNWHVDNDLGKPEVYKTLVLEGKGVGDAPEPQQSYLDKVLDTGVKAEKAAETAEEFAAVATATAKRFDETFSVVVQTAERNAVEANERAQEAAGNARASAESASASEQAAAEHRAAAETAEAGAEEAEQGALSAAERAEAAAVKEGAYAEQAGAFAQEAGAANEQAQEAAGNAQRSAENAAASEQTVKENADNAAASEENARASAESASASEQAAAEHRAAAETAEAGAEEAEQGALSAAERAEAAAVKEGAYAEQAGAFAQEAGAANEQAQEAAGNAQRSAENAAASERASAEHRAATEEAEELAKSYTANPPVIGGNGNWWTWNGSQYVDSGNVATGELTVRQGNTLYANALKGTASGTVIRVDDVSPLEHTVPVRVSSRNLLDPSAWNQGTIASITVDGDNIVVAKNGTTNIYNITSNTSLEAGKTYTISCESVSAHGTYWGWYVKYEDGTSSSTNDAGNNSTILTITPTKNVVSVYFRFGYGDAGADSITMVKPQITESAEVLPYTPYVPDLTAVTVHAHGKNLYNNVDYGLINPKNAIAFSATKTETGYSLTGSAGNSYWVLVPLGSLAELGGKLVTLSADINGTPFAPNLVICDKAYGNRSVLYGDNFANFTGVISFSVPQASEYPDGYIVTVRLNGDANNDPTAVVTYDNIQVEIGDTATEYEPYIEPVTYPVVEDGTCEVTSVAPAMTLLADNPNVVMDCEYNRDINKAFDQLVQAILSMGGNI